MPSVGNFSPARFIGKVCGISLFLSKKSSRISNIYVVIVGNNCFMVKFQFFAEKFDSKLFLTCLTSFSRMTTCIFGFLVIFRIRKVLRCKLYRWIERIYDKHSTINWLIRSSLYCIQKPYAKQKDGSLLTAEPLEAGNVLRQSSYLTDCRSDWRFIPRTRNLTEVGSV